MPGPDDLGPGWGEGAQAPGRVRLPGRQDEGRFRLVELARQSAHHALVEGCRVVDERERIARQWPIREDIDQVERNRCAHSVHHIGHTLINDL